MVSAALSPLDLEGLRKLQPEAAIWLLSARGRNVDILRAAETARRLEPAVILSLTATEGSPLTTFVKAQPVGESYEFASPAGQDGFLATNSLLCTVLLLYRSYRCAIGLPDELPPFDQLLGTTDDIVDLVRGLDNEFAQLWNREYLLLLYGPGTAVAAIDLESKFSEAALSFVSASDLRTFAHGRHHWLSRFGDRSSVLILTDRDSAPLASRTISLFPRNVLVRSIEMQNKGIAGEIEGLIRGFLLTASLGHARRVDPGRPGIADFGSAIYHIRRGIKRHRYDATTIAAERKIAAGATSSLPLALERAKAALDRLLTAQFGTLLFDLDGTLIGPKRDERWSTSGRDDVRIMLERLLDAGVRVAVATGRSPGSSTKQLLRSLFSERRWPNILVGYYNGTQTATLDHDMPDTILPLDQADFGRLCSTLEERRKALGADVQLSVKPTQLTLRSNNRDTLVRPHQLFVVAQEAIAEVSARAKAVRSTHSVDIIHQEASKSRIADIVADQESGSILRFGDTGAWPGNDFELLADPFGLSVDAVSTDLETCWNFLPRGTRSVDGTLYYLERLDVLQRGTVSFRSRSFG